jgi:hypothetical protein
MRWTKLGAIFTGPGDRSWAKSHAAVPVCLPIDDRRVLVLYSARDADNRSRPGSFVVDVDTLRVTNAGREPLLDLGPPGTFDDAGVMPCWAVPYQDGWLVYYIGWNKAVAVPFQNAIGAARVSADGRSWTRVSPGPLVARSVRDPHFVASCAVLGTGADWRMWYLSCLGWYPEGGRLRHRYHIRQMSSADPLTWNGAAEPAIDFAAPDEYAISRPSVLRDGTHWHMWYSVRGQRYRIGYASSSDGRRWARRDADVGITASSSGWDSEMICYPHVFRIRDRVLMAYNGNGYGATGIGLAELATPLD